MYWEAQWLIGEIEETRRRAPLTWFEEVLLDFLLRLEP
jgi:hypothetical protein